MVMPLRTLIWACVVGAVMWIVMYVLLIVVLTALG
jgi:hypothetical protein